MCGGGPAAVAGGEGGLKKSRAGLRVLAVLGFLPSFFAFGCVRAGVVGSPKCCPLDFPLQVGRAGRKREPSPSPCSQSRTCITTPNWSSGMAGKGPIPKAVCSRAGWALLRGQVKLRPWPAKAAGQGEGWMTSRLHCPPWHHLPGEGQTVYKCRGGGARIADLEPVGCPSDRCCKV